MRLLVASLCIVSAGCNRPSTAAPYPCSEMPFTATGMQGQPLAANTAAGVFEIPVTVGSVTQPAVFDTGSPVTLLDPTVFAGQGVPSGSGPLASLQIGVLDIEDAGVIGVAPGLSTPDGPVNALVGGDQMCHFTTSFDYRAPQMFLGEATLPSDLQAPTTFSAPIEGGGPAQLALGSQLVTVSLPSTRITLDATIEGAVHPMVLDTGASMTLMRSTVFAQIASDGRPTLAEGASTIMGMEAVNLMRTKAISVGSAEVDNTVAGGFDDSIFDSLAREVGHPVDGLIGGTWLREFLVTVDYAEDQVTLRQYPNRDHIHDEFIRVGFAGASSNGQYIVTVVFSGTDAAAQGIKVGTRIVSVDGSVLTGLSPTSADALLVGAAGTTKSVQTDTTTLNIEVQDLFAL